MYGIAERQKSMFFRKNSNKFFKTKFVHEMSALGQVQNLGIGL